MHALRNITFIFCTLFFTAGVFAQDSPAYTPTSEYTVRNIYGWNIYVSSDLADQPDLDQRAMRMLEMQLRQIEFLVPPPAVEKLRTVKIWIQGNNPTVKTCCFHPDIHWLNENGVNPDKCDSVDIPDAQNMLNEYDRQPMLVLHELAHAYHHLFLENGFENAEVKDTYHHAMEAGRYQSVLNFFQITDKAYAATNQQEYFAELTECYFGENDFFPFVRTEFRNYDPEGLKMIESVWGI